MRQDVFSAIPSCGNPVLEKPFVAVPFADDARVYVGVA
jgi:hypothetical protein